MKPHATYALLADANVLQRVKQFVFIQLQVQHVVLCVLIPEHGELLTSWRLRPVAKSVACAFCATLSLSVAPLARFVLIIDPCSQVLPFFGGYFCDKVRNRC